MSKKPWLALSALVVALAHASPARAACDAGVDAGGCPAGCTSDTECASTEFCEGQTGDCVAKLTDGTALPSGDTCDPITAARECASMMCDPASNACGTPKQPSVDAGISGSNDDAGASGTGASAGPTGPIYIVGGGGCSCRATESDASSSLVACSALAILVFASLRRRRDARSSPKTN